MKKNPAPRKAKPKKAVAKPKKIGTKPKVRPAAAPKRPAAPKRARPDAWNLKLYVAGQTPKSLAAFANLKRLCEEHLAGRYTIEVIDLMKSPQLAQGDQIVALPTLVRRIPAPIKRVIGDLSDLQRVMVGMDIKPIILPPAAP